MIHALATRGRKKGGEKLHCIPGTYPKSQGSLCISFAFLAFGGVVFCTKSAWPVLGTVLTGFCLGLALVHGGLHMCRGSSCMLWWFVLFACAWFCLGCVEPLSWHEGSETCLLQVILFFVFLGFRSLVGVSFYSFLFFFFFFLVTKCVCCQCTHQAGNWGPCVVRGPVDRRFLVWWVIDNVVWTDSWLCNVGAGCSLTGVGAGEEQARKVVSGEASRCGEDK
jgi:hypothetical protein